MGKKIHSDKASVLISTILASTIANASYLEMNSATQTVVATSIESGNDEAFAVTFPSDLRSKILQQLAEHNLTLVDGEGYNTVAKENSKSTSKSSLEIQKMLMRSFPSSAVTVTPLEAMTLSAQDGWGSK